MYTVQGAIAWEAAKGAAGQLRIAATGQVLGLDMNAALALAAALGCAPSVAGFLLPLAEDGIVEAMNEKPAEDADVA